MQNINKNKFAKAINNHISKKADMDIVSLIGIIEDLTNISDRCYHEQIDSVEASFEIDKVIDELEGWKPYVTNNLKSSREKIVNKKAAYPFYEMVKDTSPLYTPNDPIGVQSDEHNTTIDEMRPDLTGIDYETEFALAGLSNKYPNVKIDLAQVEKGIKVEMEHTSNKQVALKIALDHLAEISNYYDLLAEMEDKAKEMGTFNKEIKTNE